MPLPEPIPEPVPEPEPLPLPEPFPIPLPCLLMPDGTIICPAIVLDDSTVVGGPDSAVTVAASAEKAAVEATVAADATVVVQETRPAPPRAFIDFDGCRLDGADDCS